MNEPVTELDSRFSDPAAVAAGWEETRRTLADAELFWICSVRADGRPHLTPLVAVWDGQWQFQVHDGSFQKPRGPVRARQPKDPRLGVLRVSCDGVSVRSVCGTDALPAAGDDAAPVTYPCWTPRAVRRENHGRGIGHECASHREVPG